MDIGSAERIPLNVHHGLKAMGLAELSRRLNLLVDGVLPFLRLACALAVEVGYTAFHGERTLGRDGLVHQSLGDQGAGTIQSRNDEHLESAGCRNTVGPRVEMRRPASHRSRVWVSKRRFGVLMSGVHHGDHRVHGERLELHRHAVGGNDIQYFSPHGAAIGIQKLTQRAFDGCTSDLRDGITRQPGRGGAPRSPHSVR